MKLFGIFSAFAISCITIAGCVSVQLSEEAKSVIVQSSGAPDCFSIERKTYTSPIVLSDPEVYRQNLITKIKNDAASMGADQVFVHNDEIPKKGISSIEVTFYTCLKVSAINESALEKICKHGYGQGCAEIAIRSQRVKDFPKMMDYFNKACKLSDKMACEWITNFQIKKEQFKKDCLRKDGESCFAAAKIADVEQSFSLMMTFLKQGCSYGHSECCFYSTFVQEEKERIKELQQNRYQQYMVDLQAETLRQQKISNAIAILNQTPKNCVSRKNFDDSVYTSCY